MKKSNYIGLKCPIPVLKAFKVIKSHPKETKFEFMCDDPTAVKDFTDLCKNTGLKLNKIINKKSFIIITINRI